MVCDKDISYATINLKSSSSRTIEELDIHDLHEVSARIQKSKIVISLLPAALHIHIAKICLQENKHLATASYISDEMKALDTEAKAKGLIFLNEIGLDPGIDHMSAVQMMDAIRLKGDEITSFKSYCGGLTADEDDGDNPWKYKFSWNPRNVVLAAQGPPATYLENGTLKILPYHQVFTNPLSYSISGYGDVEAYANRDSLKYIDLYGLSHVKDMIRGTFRKPGYSKAWNVFVSLGLTDDSHVLHLPANTSMMQWIQMYLPDSKESIEAQIQRYCHCSKNETDKLAWLGFFSDEILPIHNGSSAQILEEILKVKWKLEINDKDMVIMLHEIGFESSGIQHKQYATMVLIGESNIHTAMAKTVGLPLAIACKLILENKISERGVIAPVYSDIYTPVLEELKEYGIHFVESAENKG